MSEQKLWLVQYFPEAVVDFQAIQARKERISVLTAVDKLVSLGPSLRPPHMKSLKGEPNLMELRPRQGASPVRPIYARFADGFTKRGEPLMAVISLAILGVIAISILAAQLTR